VRIVLASGRNDMKEHIITIEQKAWREKNMGVIYLMQRQMSMEMRPVEKSWADDPEVVKVYLAAYERKE
jgi:hypothetical protein